MQRLKTFLTVVGAATILVLAANSAVYAATGGKFILGKTNKANAVSTLKRTTNGAALKLVTKTSSAPPLTTNGRGKVANLNADTVDGMDSSALRTGSYLFNSSVTNKGLFNIVLPVPAGTYLVSWRNSFSGVTSVTSVSCYVIEANPGAPARSYAHLTVTNSLAEFAPVLNGSGIVTKKDGGTLTFHCLSANLDDFSTPSDIPIQVVLTPTTTLGTATLTPEP